MFRTRASPNLTKDYLIWFSGTISIGNPNWKQKVTLKAVMYTSPQGREERCSVKTSLAIGPPISPRNDGGQLGANCRGTPGDFGGKITRYLMRFFSQLPGDESLFCPCDSVLIAIITENRARIAGILVPVFGD